MTTDEYRGGPARHWTVKLRLAIDADNADSARDISAEVLQKMGVVSGAEPELRQTARARPYWNVIVIRQLPGVSFAGQGDAHRGLWQWLPDSWDLAMSNQEFPHPAVRAAGIYISADSEA